ncbi:MAG: hypothetical protein AAGC55_26010, partial [Myxococcota bacterium]
LQLEVGQSSEAERTFSAAAKQAPSDPIAREALAGLYRLDERTVELTDILSELTGLVVHRDKLGEVLHELGLLQTNLQDDSRGARATLERALEIEPNDPTTLHALALLHDRAREWEQSVALRHRAAAIPDDQRLSRYDIEDIDRATLYMEIGEIEEHRRRDDQAALRAYEAALDCAEDQRPMLQAQARIYRRMRKLDTLLEVLRSELALDPERERKLQVLLDIASLCRDDKAGSRDVDAALEAYQEVLRIDPGSSTALSGIRAIGRAERRWDVIADAYRNSPPSGDGLDVLAEALEMQQDWVGLAKVRTEQMERAEGVAAKGRIAYELADIHHRKLGQIGPAIAAYQQAVEYGIEVADSQRKLAHILEEHERWPELEDVYERQLAAVAPTDVDRQIRILLRLGALRRDQLDKPAAAAQSFEALLERQPHYVPALEALEELYARLGREKELLRVLDARCEATEDMAERSQLKLRIAEIRQRRGEIDQAVQAFREGFEAMPTNREVFTSM